MIFFDMNKREDLKEKCSTLFSIFWTYSHCFDFSINSVSRILPFFNGSYNLNLHYFVFLYKFAPHPKLPNFSWSSYGALCIPYLEFLTPRNCIKSFTSFDCRPLWCNQLLSRISFQMSNKWKSQSNWSQRIETNSPTMNFWQINLNILCFHRLLKEIIFTTSSNLLAGFIYLALLAQSWMSANLSTLWPFLTLNQVWRLNWLWGKYIV